MGSRPAQPPQIDWAAASSGSGGSVCSSRNLSLPDIRWWTAENWYWCDVLIAECPQLVACKSMWYYWKYIWPAPMRHRERGISWKPILASIGARKMKTVVSGEPFKWQLMHMMLYLSSINITGVLMVTNLVWVFVRFGSRLSWMEEPICWAGVHVEGIHYQATQTHKQQRA